MMERGPPFKHDGNGFVVEALGIRKSFAGVAVLRGCDLGVRRGEIHALLGQNGAGKSTLVKILNGVYPWGSFDGKLLIEGHPVAFRSPAQARRNRVGYVPQEIEVIEHLSVAENIFAGRTGLGQGLFVPWRQMERQAAVLLDDLGLTLSPTAPVVLLSAAQRHLVMLARALAAHPAVLILDEPTASLSSVETERLFTVLRRLKARGTTMIYITHRLPELFALCDRASVLRDGAIADEYDRERFSLEQLIAAMSGRRLEFQFPLHRGAVSAPVLLKVEHLSVNVTARKRVHDIGFELREGEILGIAGLLGAGKTELLGALYGDLPHRGRLVLGNRPLSITSPRHARRAGLALLTEDRKRDGLLFNLPVRGNITLGNLGLFSTAGWVRSRAELQSVLRQITALNIKTPSPEASVAHLSGGNQQKLLFARVLLRRPKVLLLDDPSKGVDVATRHEIYRLIVDLAESGVGVIIVSSELEEVLGLADRILVLAEGNIVDEFNRGEGDEERILHSVATAQSWRVGNTSSFL
jgi:ribose transport system ATP-binding protein